jgi:hypothetical protein
MSVQLNKKGLLCIMASVALGVLFVYCVSLFLHGLTNIGRNKAFDDARHIKATLIDFKRERCLVGSRLSVSYQYQIAGKNYTGEMNSVLTPMNCFFHWFSGREPVELNPDLFSVHVSRTDSSISMVDIKNKYPLIFSALLSLIILMFASFAGIVYFSSMLLFGEVISRPEKTLRTA